jgi:hypothetical protein
MEEVYVVLGGEADFQIEGVDWPRWGTPAGRSLSRRSGSPWSVEDWSSPGLDGLDHRTRSSGRNCVLVLIHAAADCHEAP